MENQRKWAGWIIIGVAVILGATVLTLNQGTAVEAPAAQEHPSAESITYGGFIKTLVIFFSLIHKLASSSLASNCAKLVFPSL